MVKGIVYPLVFLTAVPCYADQIDQEINWLQAELTATVEASTYIATKTLLGQDSVPGQVSVLRGKDLEARGIHTVVEALSLFPGTSTSFNDPTVRGIEGSTSGKLKILVNGIPFNTSITGKGTPSFSIPIELVEKIEMIRGPGSAVYGEYASVGVINIVTRKDGNFVYGEAGSYSSFSEGGSYSLHEKDFSTYVTVANHSQNGQDIFHPTDVMYQMGQGNVSYAPGNETNNDLQKTAFFGLAYKDFSFSGQYIDFQTGAGIGTSNALPPVTNKMIWDESQYSLEAVQKLSYDNYHTSLKLGIMDYTVSMDHNVLFPPGTWTAAPSITDMTVPGFPQSFSGYHPNGVVASTLAEERRVYSSVEVSKKYGDHGILVGTEYSNDSIVNLSTSANTVSSSDISASSYHSFDSNNTYIKKGAGRQIESLVLQDQYLVTKDLNITAGMRVDNYSDVGTAVTPRIAATYSVTENHSVKAQYGQSFRPPTFFEQYSNNYVLTGNPKISPETVNTYELGHVYRNKDTAVKTTFFWSELNNLIESNTSGIFVNSTKAVVKGSELEVEKTISSSLKIDGNLSYVDTWIQDTGSQIGGSANWLGNLGIVWAKESYSVYFGDKYIGPRNSLPNDSRQKIGSTNIVNTAISFYDVMLKNVTVRAGIQDIFNTVETDLDPYASYAGNFPRPGRNFSIKMSYNF